MGAKITIPEVSVSTKVFHKFAHLRYDVFLELFEGTVFSRYEQMCVRACVRNVEAAWAFKTPIQHLAWRVWSQSD